MIWEQNEGSELVVVLTMVQVEVATEVMDVIEVVTDKQMHKVRDEFPRGVADEEDDKSVPGFFVSRFSYNFWSRDFRDSRLYFICL